jgi:hypothetical protein
MSLVHSQYQVVDPIIIIQVMDLTKIGKHMKAQHDQQHEISKILIWPTNHLFNLLPRVVFYPCNEFVEMCDRWLLICYTEKETGTRANETILWITVRVLDLATGRMCDGFFKKSKSRVFLQRASKYAAIVLYAAIRNADPLQVIDWSLWQFSASEQTDHGPRYLMKGKCILSNIRQTFFPV